MNDWMSAQWMNGYKEGRGERQQRRSLKENDSGGGR